VVLLSACGQGVKNSVDARIEPVANNITIVSQAEAVPGGPPAQNLTDADAAALQGAPDIATVTPVVTSATTPATGSVQEHSSKPTPSSSSRRTSSVSRTSGPRRTTGTSRRDRFSTRPRPVPRPEWWSWVPPSRAPFSVIARRR
jgi:hypothetical protein